MEKKFTQIKLVVEKYAFEVSIDIAYILNKRYAHYMNHATRLCVPVCV